LDLIRWLENPTSWSCRCLWRLGLAAGAGSGSAADSQGEAAGRADSTVFSTLPLQVQKLKKTGVTKTKNTLPIFSKKVNN